MLLRQKQRNGSLDLFARVATGTDLSPTRLLRDLKAAAVLPPEPASGEPSKTLAKRKRQ